MVYFHLSEEALQNLKKYKYNGSDSSIMEMLFFNHFWDAIVWFFPPWLHPNAITLAAQIFPMLALAV